VLLGEFEQRLDDKNRVTLPARLREHFADGVVCARGLDGCVSVFPHAGWEEYMNAQNERLDGFSREGRWMQRYLFSGALQGELDKQGRVALPASLLQHAQLGKDIVIAGLRDRLEIWDREAWRRGRRERRECCRTSCPVEALKPTYRCWRARSARCSTCTLAS
jgi:MraZ protein